MSTACSITYIGGPTALIEIGGMRLLTDPTFDPPGQHYNFGLPFIGSTKTQGPAIGLDELGRIDVVLLSHDQHPDNLDTRGRDALTRAGRVLTTTAGAKRLGGNADGLRPWESTVLGDDRRRITVTATPARHGVPGISLLSGPDIGFMLEWAGQRHGALYLSGDTVYFGGIDKIAGPLPGERGGDPFWWRSIRRFWTRPVHVQRRRRAARSSGGSGSDRGPDPLRRLEPLLHAALRNRFNLRRRGQGRHASLARSWAAARTRGLTEGAFPSDRIHRHMPAVER